MMEARDSGVMETRPLETRTSNEDLSSKTGISFLPVGHNSPDKVSKCALAWFVK
jgi:hypothetical protein